jgi:hypothetical protein
LIICTGSGFVSYAIALEKRLSGWKRELLRPHDRTARLFARTEARERSLAYLQGLATVNGRTADTDRVDGSFLKKREHSVGGKSQYTGTARRINNSQGDLFLCNASGKGAPLSIFYTAPNGDENIYSTLSDATIESALRLYLPSIRDCIARKLMPSNPGISTSRQMTSRTSRL